MDEIKENDSVAYWSLRQYLPEKPVKVRKLVSFDKPPLYRVAEQ